MNINNFEEYIDKRILSRGYDYYVYPIKNDGCYVSKSM